MGGWIKANYVFEGLVNTTVLWVGSWIIAMLLYMHEVGQLNVHRRVGGSIPLYDMGGFVVGIQMY